MISLLQTSVESSLTQIEVLEMGDGRATLRTEPRMSCQISLLTALLDPQNNNYGYEIPADIVNH